LRLTRSFETLQVGCGPHLAELWWPVHRLRGADARSLVQV